MSVRVRYAPSPTGLQHVGGIRTALFNYFFAKANGGTFILRIEDTDQKRSSLESLDDLYSTLEWLGITIDEGPYFQSERKAIYTQKAGVLVDAGNAYPCFCTAERLDELREHQKSAKTDIGYDRRCRDLSPDEAAKRIQDGHAHVIRLKIPMEGKTEFYDVLHGRTGRKNKDINPDPVIIKSDGWPTYHLANVIDDHMMKITHIMRAQEWIPSGPLHVLIYKAFGWDAPLYCHLPMVMGKDGQKLSKRHGSTAVSHLRKAGYLPEALINFISLLGWHYDDSREFFSMDDLCQLFSMEKINRSSAIFDYQKLEWFNGQYIRMKDPRELKKELLGILSREKIISPLPTVEEMRLYDGAFPIVRERVKVLDDVVPMTRFLFADPGLGPIEDAIPKKMNAEQSAQLLKKAMDILRASPEIPEMDNVEACENWDHGREEEFRQTAQEMECKLGDVFRPLRMAVTASKVSLPIFPSIRLLGLSESLRRSKRLHDQLVNL